ncbi:MAG: ornithine decarboxylase, partial [Nitrosomonas sp.]|nr:ornithine decarboxylase [Nitrosomonas sp.]
MKTPLSRILINNDEKLVLKELIKGLKAAAKTMENPFGILISGVTTAHEALQSIEQDGDIQGLVVDDRLYTLKNHGKHARDLQITAL